LFIEANTSTINILIERYCTEQVHISRCRCENETSWN